MARLQDRTRETVDWVLGAPVSCSRTSSAERGWRARTLYDSTPQTAWELRSCQLAKAGQGWLGGGRDLQDARCDEGGPGVRSPLGEHPGSLHYIRGLLGTTTAEPSHEPTFALGL